MKTARAAAMGVALTVSGLTRLAGAETPPPSPTTTPLTLAPSRPLEGPHETPSGGLGWKLLAAAVVIAGGAAWARSRMRSAGVSEASLLRIGRRVSLGIRSELVVVEVEGQRLLLGVTAAGIQHLASLDPAPEAESVLRGATPFGRQFSAVLDAAERRPGPERRALSVPARSTPPVDDAIPGQARGLLKLGKR